MQGLKGDLGDCGGCGDSGRLILILRMEKDRKSGMKGACGKDWSEKRESKIRIITFVSNELASKGAFSPPLMQRK